MTDEEKAAKRKARRDARMAEANAHRDAHITFKTNKNAGISRDIIYDLCKTFSSDLGQFEIRSGSGEDHYGYMYIFEEKKDAAGNSHTVVIDFDLSKMRKLSIVGQLEIDGRETGDTCGEDNNSYRDFKDLFDSLDISYMRSMSEPASLFRGSYSFSPYKWFKRGGGELNGRLWSFPSFRGYENDDAEVKGWKLS